MFCTPGFPQTNAGCRAMSKSCPNVWEKQVVELRPEFLRGCIAERGSESVGVQMEVEAHDRSLHLFYIRRKWEHGGSPGEGDAISFSGYSPSGQAFLPQSWERRGAEHEILKMVSKLTTLFCICLEVSPSFYFVLLLFLSSPTLTPQTLLHSSLLPLPNPIFLLSQQNTLLLSCSSL